HSPAGSRTTLTVDTTSPAVITVRVDTVSPPGGGPPTPVPSGGGGLAGMHERIALRGGARPGGPTDTGWLRGAVLPRSPAGGRGVDQPDRSRTDAGGHGPSPTGGSTVGSARIWREGGQTADAFDAEPAVRSGLDDRRGRVMSVPGVSSGRRCSERGVWWAR